MSHWVECATSEGVPLPYEHLIVPCSLDERLSRVTQALRARLPSPCEDYERTRADAEAAEATALEDLATAGLSVSDVDAGGVRGLLVEPPGATGTLVGLHGGSYVLCSPRTHARRFAAIGTAASMRTLLVDYRLAPEHPFPAAVEDAVAALTWATATLPGPLGIVGDSAGGGLALATLLRTRDLGGPLPGAAVVISPWADLSCSAPSHRERRARDPFAHLDDLRGYAALYAGGAPLDDPLLSPVRGRYDRLPPLLLQVGSEEVLYDDAVGVAIAADASGVPVVLEEWSGMFHTWHGHVGELTGADEAAASAARFLRMHLE